jgi:hypothetical protein
MGEIKNTYNFLAENLNGMDHSEDVGVNMIILECILGKWGGEIWIGCIWLWIGISEF